MAKQHRMALLTVVALWCGLAPTAWQPVWGEPDGPGLVAVGLAVILFGSLVTAVRRLLRIADNLRKSRP